jgi:hypothetical protein
VTRKKIVSLGGTIAAAIALVSASGAATGTVPAVAKIDVSSKAKVHQYLRSIHVNPKGVVIQRGQRNYAGPHCPGKGWNCTTARRVIQIATSASAGSGRSFLAAGSTNVASCVKVSGSNQTCSITQTALVDNVSNKATVTQVIGQSGQTLNGTQSAQVTQTSTNGSNTVQLDQVIGQLSATSAASVNQSQNSTQTFNVSQTSTSGVQTLKATQTSGQAETAPKATTGTQFANGLLDAHFIQASAGLSTMTLTQTHAPVLQAKGPVDQTVIDPMKCCSNQSTNPNDTVTLKQNGIVKTSGDATPNISSLFEANCQSSGNCTATQTSNVNGQTNTNTASGSTISETFTCIGSDCSTGEIIFNGSPGTAAPPATLGGYTMTPFGVDSQALGNVSGVTGPTGSIGFTPALSHDTVPSGGWATWSHGYTGDVYDTAETADPTQATIMLPAGTKAFYLYAEPNDFDNFTVQATAQDGTTSGPVTVQGNSGAQYFGFYGTGDATIASITITCNDISGFAVGEFGISNGIVIT